MGNKQSKQKKAEFQIVKKTMVDLNAFIALRRELLLTTTMERGRE